LQTNLLNLLKNYVYFDSVNIGIFSKD